MRCIQYYIRRVLLTKQKTANVNKNEDRLLPVEIIATGESGRGKFIGELTCEK